jgi:protein-tyrosine phosphatase
MIDLHSHVLPGLDDGAATSADAVAMAQIAARAGTTVLVATPHLRDDHHRVRADELADRAAELDALVRGYGIPLRVVPGAEVAFARARTASDAELRMATLAGNGRDLLVEPPAGPLDPGLPLVLADLGRRGFRVMLAHPERVAEWQAAPEELGHLTAAGVLVQVTAAALTRPRRARSRRLAERALRAGWVHALASDAHGTDDRTPDLRPGLRAAERLLGARDAGWLVRVAPAAVLAGRELPPRAGASATGPDE